MNILAMAAALQRLGGGALKLGPGLQEPIAGTMEFGFFGEVSAQELIDGESLASLLGVTGIGTVNMPALKAGWLKFTREGKVLFISKRALRYSLSWSQLDSVNAVNGSRIETIGDNGFSVRLMSGGNGTPSTAAGGEWDDLIKRIVRPLDAGLGEWATYTKVELDIANGTAAETLCMETTSSGSTYIVGRGRNVLGTYASVLKTSANVWNAWRPVLELVQPSASVLGVTEVSYVPAITLHSVASVDGDVVDRLAVPSDISYTSEPHTSVADIGHSTI